MTTDVNLSNGIWTVNGKTYREMSLFEMQYFNNFLSEKRSGTDKN